MQKDKKAFDWKMSGANQGLAQLIDQGPSQLDALLEYVFDLWSSRLEGEKLSWEALQENIQRQFESISSPSKDVVSPNIKRPLIGSSSDNNMMEVESTTTRTSNEETSTSSSTSFNDPSDSVAMTDFQNAQQQHSEGRIGPKFAVLNKKGAVGTLKLSDNGLEAESFSNFCSARANVCVFKGKWMYEVALGSAGIQQIGWAPLDAPFTNEEGVGDSADSFAYDGKRIKKWNVSCHTYGQAWSTGDVIGCCIDLDRGQISFYRNGSNLGVAFENVRCGENAVGIAYFPALSLSSGEKSTLNFGGKPFQYPVEGYRPIQSPPPQENIVKANYLVECCKRLLPLVVENESTSNAMIKSKFLSIRTPNFPTEMDATFLFGTIFQHLAPLLQNEYVLVTSFYSFLESLVLEGKQDHFNKLIELILTCAEPFELSDMISHTMSHAGFLTRTVSFIRSATENIKKRGNHSEAVVTSSPSSSLALQLLKFPAVMDTFVSLPNFPIFLENLFSSKQPSPQELTQQIPNIWWASCEEQEEMYDKEKFQSSLDRLQVWYQETERTLYEISSLFLDDDRTKLERGDTPSQVFRVWLRSLVSKNKGATRSNAPPGLSDPSVLTNVYFVLLRRLDSWTVNHDVSEFPSSIFTNGKLDYFDFTRIGGLISHLSKNLPADPRDLQNDGSPISLQVELFDDLVMFYHFGMSAKFKQASVHLQNLMQTLAQLEDTNKRIKRLLEQGNTGGPIDPTLNHFNKAKRLFKDDAADYVRLGAWQKVQLFQEWKQESMFHYVLYIVRLLNRLSDFNPLFSYVPEFYLDTLIDAFHALRRGDPPLLLTEGVRLEGLIEVIGFLMNHFDDKRIVNPDVRDLLLQSISVLLQYSEFVRAFESEILDKHKFVRSLLETFDTRFWIPISNILLRFWRGSGFAQPAKKNNDCSSEVYQRVFREVCAKDPQLLNEFLNRVFNNLNWAVTEFGVMAKELQGIISSNHYVNEMQQIQRKTNVMFELSVSLLRMIEFITLEAPNAFLEQEMNATRLSELLLFVLNRTTTGHDAKILESLLKLEINALEKVNRLSILAPVAGILINLENKDGSNFAKTLASTGGFNLETLDYLLKFDWTKIPNPPATATLAHHQPGQHHHPIQQHDDSPKKQEQENPVPLTSVLKRFVDTVEKETAAIQQAEENKSTTISSSSSGDFCPICCSNIIDTMFEPCHHVSCNMCIKRHLLNSKKCFFCNAEITTTHSIHNKHAEEGEDLMKD